MAMAKVLMRAHQYCSMFWIAEPAARRSQYAADKAATGRVVFIPIMYVGRSRVMYQCGPARLGMAVRA